MSFRRGLSKSLLVRKMSPHLSGAQKPEEMNPSFTISYRDVSSCDNKQLAPLSFGVGWTLLLMSLSFVLGIVVTFMIDRGTCQDITAASLWNPTAAIRGMQAAALNPILGTLAPSVSSQAGLAVTGVSTALAGVGTTLYYKGGKLVKKQLRSPASGRRREMMLAGSGGSSHTRYDHIKRYPKIVLLLREKKLAEQGKVRPPPQVLSLISTPKRSRTCVPLYISQSASSASPATSEGLSPNRGFSPDGRSSVLSGKVARVLEF